MKKNFRFAFVGAIALLGAVGISSCSSSSDEVIDNPDYNPETNTVKVQLAISLQENIAGTRMSADAVQSTGTIAKFLGMKNIKLIPYNSSTDIASTTSILDNLIIGLSDISASNSGDATEANKVYSNVAVPVNTNRFLLYGEAGLTQGFDNGALTVAGLNAATATDVSGVSFTPVSIATDAQTTGSTTFKNLLQLLNRVAKSSVTDGTTTTTWATGTNQTTVAALASLYTTFSKVSVGSSQYVKDALEDLYNSINDDANLVGNTLAAQIKSNITDALNYTDGGTSHTCAANTFDTSTKKLSLSTDYTGYPASAHLPEGAPRIGMNTTSGEFEDATNHSIGTITATDLSQYAYPANLQYFVQTDILTANTAVLNGTMSTFSAAQGLYGSSPQKSVAADTRSILLNKQVQYGVGRLDASVNAMTGTKYFDNKGAEVTIPAGGYTLTGILIGDQRAVDWSYTTKSGTTPYTLYDNMIAGVTTGSAVTKTAGSVTNYTLVLETKDDTSVNIALEFVNNGSDFEGAEGVIPAGSTFYLIGTLTPNQGGSNYGTGEGKTKKVFAQDFVTTATFTIGTGASPTDATTYGGTPAGLGLAHIGLPDLTMPQMELGLSVNLQWQSGLTFNVNF